LAIFPSLGLGRLLLYHGYQGKGRRKGVLSFCEHFGISEESAPHRVPSSLLIASAYWRDIAENIPMVDAIVRIIIEITIRWISLLQQCNISSNIFDFDGNTAVISLGTSFHFIYVITLAYFIYYKTVKAICRYYQS
jgi:hypothetical protein